MGPSIIRQRNSYAYAVIVSAIIAVSFFFGAGWVFAASPYEQSHSTELQSLLHEKMPSESAKPIPHSECESLDIEINADGKTSKDEIVKAIRIISDYPLIENSAISNDSESLITFEVSLSPNCSSKKCVRQSGWIELQERLSQIPGTAIFCAGSGDEQEEDDKGENDGGVTNGG